MTWLLFMWIIIHSLSRRCSIGQTFTSLSYSTSRAVYIPPGRCFQLPCDCLSPGYREVEWHKRFHCNGGEQTSVLTPNYNDTSLRVDKASVSICTVGNFTCRFKDEQTREILCQTIVVKLSNCLKKNEEPSVFPPSNVTDIESGEEAVLVCKATFPCSICLESRYSYLCTSGNMAQCQSPIYRVTWYFREDTQNSKGNGNKIRVEDEPRYNVSNQIINGGEIITSKLVISFVENEDFKREFICVVTSNDTERQSRQSYSAFLRSNKTEVKEENILLLIFVPFVVLFLFVVVLLTVIMRKKLIFRIRSYWCCCSYFCKTDREYDVFVYRYEDHGIFRDVLKTFERRGYRTASREDISGNQDEVHGLSDLSKRSESVVILFCSDYQVKQGIRNLYEALIDASKKDRRAEFITLVYEDDVQNRLNDSGVYCIRWKKGNERKNFKKLFQRMPKPRNGSQLESEQTERTNLCNTSSSVPHGNCSHNY